jgi:hypothetical protein
MSEDMSRAQLVKPAAFKPDTHWNYSSGTTNLLSVFYVNNSNASRIFRFLVFGLIDKIGMNSMVHRNRYGRNYVALLMDGQQQGIGQNSDCCICTKVTGTEAGSGRELGKYSANLPIHLRVNMERNFG